MLLATEPWRPCCLVAFVHERKKRVVIPVELPQRALIDFRVIPLVVRIFFLDRRLIVLLLGIRDVGSFLLRFIAVFFPIFDPLGEGEIIYEAAFLGKIVQDRLLLG